MHWCLPYLPWHKGTAAGWKGFTSLPRVLNRTQSHNSPMAMKLRSRKGSLILPGTKPLLAFFLFLQCTFSAAQVNPRQLDSLSRAIEDRSRSVMAWQDSFQRRQDSLYRAGLARVNQQGKFTNRSSTKGITVTVPLIAVLLTMLVLVVLKRKNR